jgi:hypothetical protein
MAITAEFARRDADVAVHGQAREPVPLRSF